jgi:hypothetical protein
LQNLFLPPDDLLLNFMSAISGLDPAINAVLAAKEGAVRTEIAFAVEGKRLDSVRSQGEAAAQLVEQAASLGKELGKGGNFDAVA